MDKFIKGMDVSTLPEETALGAKYYDEGKEGDALEILKKYFIWTVAATIPAAENGLMPMYREERTSMSSDCPIILSGMEPLMI